MIDYGKVETPWDLRPLLFVGGAATYIRRVADQIAHGDLGRPVIDRIPLVRAIHGHLTDKIAEGGSRESIADSIVMVRLFYRWADETGHSVTFATIEEDFVQYSEHLLHRARVVRDLRMVSAYSYALGISRIIDDVLQLKSGLLAKTRLQKSKAKRRALGTQAEKQSLEEAFAFGRVLMAITEALSIEAIRGPVPLRIDLGNGHVLEEWCGLRSTDCIRTLHHCKGANVVQLRRSEWERDISNSARRPLINLRIECEILIFLAQTSMNLAQASNLTIGQFRYQSHLDGYRVIRNYKGRRGGEVEFEIYSEYRAHFERYLSWRKEVFPAEEDLLFPIIRVRGAIRSQIDFQSVKKRFRDIDVPCVMPRKLRATRVNWLLRHSRDPELTAEMSQHSQETLLRVYDQPHHHVAAVEVTRFLMAGESSISMPGPGSCTGGTPSPEATSPQSAPAPDCISPAGCLFCRHQRDLDGEDHVWSLTTYRYLKSLELARFRPTKLFHGDHPAACVIERITEKLSHFQSISAIFAQWVQEAIDRVAEGDYHPKWDGFVRLMELRT